MNKLFLLFFLFFLNLISSGRSAEILCWFTVPAISHQGFYQPIWRELSLRGHQVTVITPNPLKENNLPNLREIDVHFTREIVNKMNIQKSLDAVTDGVEVYKFIYSSMNEVLKKQIQYPEVRRLLDDETRKFDLIIIENFNDALYSLSHKYKAPIIGMLSAYALLPTHYSLGNPTHPVLYVDDFQVKDKIETFWERLESAYFNARIYYNYHYKFLPEAQVIAEEFIAAGIPPLYELEKNASLQIVAGNAILSYARPKVPGFIEIHSLNVKPPKPLPKDLQDVLDDAKEGFVYFSLGSNVRSVGLEAWQIEVIKSALSELPFKVLWKWESTIMENQPKNVIIRGWLPQQDVLSHPNIKAFVTQGGLQSAEEAISRAVPLVVIPFLGDQPLNAYKLSQAGIAIELDRTTLTKEKLRDAIIEVATDERYKKRAEEVRDVVYDEPMKSLDKAMWWIEYVIRHKGARHLRSPALDIPTYQYFLLDVIGFVLGVTLLGAYLVYKIVNYFRRNEVRSGKSKVKKS